MIRVTASVLALALVVSSGGCKRVTERKEAVPSKPSAPVPDPTSCAPLRAESLEALCAMWEPIRRAELGDMREVRCGRERLPEPHTQGAHAVTVLEMLYFVGERSGANSRGERWVVLFDGTSYEVVGRLTLIFGEPEDQWIGLQRRELIEPGPDPVIVLEGVANTSTDDACLSRRTERRQIVLCDRLAGGYRCIAETIGRTDAIEMSGSVHPLSSQYQPDIALRCAPAIESAGLNRDTTRRTIPAQARTLHIDGPGDFRFMPDGERITLAQRLATASCTTAF